MELVAIGEEVREWSAVCWCREEEKKDRGKGPERGRDQRRKQTAGRLAIKGTSWKVLTCAMAGHIPNPGFLLFIAVAYG